MVPWPIQVTYLDRPGLNYHTAKHTTAVRCRRSRATSTAGVCRLLDPGVICHPVLLCGRVFTIPSSFTLVTLLLIHGRTLGVSSMSPKRLCSFSRFEELQTHAQVCMSLSRVRSRALSRHNCISLLLDDTRCILVVRGSFCSKLVAALTDQYAGF